MRSRRPATSMVATGVGGELASRAGTERDESTSTEAAGIGRRKRAKARTGFAFAPHRGERVQMATERVRIEAWDEQSRKMMGGNRCNSRRKEMDKKIVADGRPWQVTADRTKLQIVER